MIGDRDTARTAFLALAGWGDAACAVLADDASFRKYFRLSRADRSAVLMDAPPEHEDTAAFARLARHLTGLGYSAPEVLAEDHVHGFLLLEDLGDETYTRRLAAGADESALYALAVDLLADLHRRPAADVLPSALVPRYDDARLLAEARLLTDWFMPAVLGGTPDADAVADYEARWRTAFPLARAVPDTLVLRDFHVDNLLQVAGRTGLAACGLLDFQDAVAGPVTYDLVSLLEDARRDIDPALVAAMTARYRDAVPGLDPDAFAASWAVLAAQRHAKVIGIFTRLSRRDGKPRYLGHIPRVWRLMEAALAHPALSDVRAWIDRHIPPERRIAPP
jgi:aminoglycoside/choline kinase family phosphotransferase